ncbi:MAG: flagellar protein FlgN [Planctomycetaceae bacterium]|jgi:flagellar biosynthesis/type III secretory pathway chaperone|nr:flagellar protein FlgN [Planctomycetaceae bacterium]
MSHTRWENDLIRYFTEFRDVQHEVLALLERNQKLLAAADAAGIEQLSQEESLAIEKLHECQQKREKLLQYAKAENLPCDSLESLAAHVVKERKPEFVQLIEDVSHKMRHLQLCGMTNWIITQRSLNHFSQLLEIITTRGRGKSTYTRHHVRNPGMNGGAIVDRKA